ncbi:MAG: hypothetical protein LBD41_01200 [Clostridiales Family XIII bacterium]|jgi:trigger factor|nr:hypothetical protein [Clostridiales Family XIII bacterium]
MEVKEISKESGKIKIEAVIARTDIEEGKKKVYAKEKNKYSIPGFRKGRVPMKMIERQYGNVFLEAAIDNLVNEAYQKALVDFSIDPILPPKLDFPEKANFDDDLKIGIDITAVPEIKVKDYLGVKIKEEKKEVKDQDIKKELKNLQERNSRLERVSRPSKSGDTVYIDFTGFIDGKKFAGGEA